MTQSDTEKHISNCSSKNIYVRICTSLVTTYDLTPTLCMYTLQYMNALKIDTVLRCQAGNCPHFTEHDPIGVRYEPGAGHF